MLPANDWLATPIGTRSLIGIARRHGLVLDATGLAHHREASIPAWYRALDDEEMIAAEAAFWTTIARYWCDWLTGHESVWRGLTLGHCRPGVRQLLGVNLPGKPDSWAFVHELARRWTEHMVSAVRTHDDEHLLTVGLVPWSLPFHESHHPGFAPLALRDVVDFISVHVYPGHAEATLEETLLTLRAAYVGLPDTQWTYCRWTLSSVSGW